MSIYGLPGESELALRSREAACRPAASAVNPIHAVRSFGDQSSIKLDFQVIWLWKAEPERTQLPCEPVSQDQSDEIISPWLKLVFDLPISHPGQGSVLQR